MSVENSEKSLKDLLGIHFEKDGKWFAEDTGKSPMMRKLNRKERRNRDKLERKKNVSNNKHK